MMNTPEEPDEVLLTREPRYREQAAGGQPRCAPSPSACLLHKKAAWEQWVCSQLRSAC